MSLSTNTDVLNGDETLKVTAVVTDPNGIDDLIGGELNATNGGGSYGSFQSAAKEGAYQRDLTWRDFDEVQTIDGGRQGEERTLQARFFDQSGHEATETFYRRAPVFRRRLRSM